MTDVLFYHALLDEITSAEAGAAGTGITTAFISTIDIAVDGNGGVTITDEKDVRPQKWWTFRAAMASFIKSIRCFCPSDRYIARSKAGFYRLFLCPILELMVFIRRAPSCSLSDPICYL